MDADLLNLTDDFFVNLNLQTTLPLPRSRETVLQFYEALQKHFPDMRSFYQREGGEYVLEGDRESGSYQWAELQAHQLSAGYFNPPSLQDAYSLHAWLLERCVYFLGVSGLDVEAMDVMFGFNLDYCGNRDQIVAEALLSGSPLASLVNDPNVRAVESEPSLALNSADKLKARLARSVAYVCLGRIDSNRRYHAGRAPCARVEAARAAT